MVVVPAEDDDDEAEVDNEDDDDDDDRDETNVAEGTDLDLTWSNGAFSLRIVLFTVAFSSKALSVLEPTVKGPLLRDDEGFCCGNCILPGSRINSSKEGVFFVDELKTLEFDCFVSDKTQLVF